jgi:hypothetical protein
VYCARDQLLSGSGLAVHEHGRIGRCDRGDLFQYSVQRIAPADDVTEVALGAYLRLEVQPFFFVGSKTLPDGVQQLFVVERFRQKGRGSCLEGAHRHGNIA